MVKHIDVFMPPISQYGVLHSMTKDLYEAMLRNGIKCRLLVAQKDNPQPFLESIFSDRPDFTFSFNGLLPDSQGQFFCEMIKIPHIAALVDSPNQYIALTQSKMNVITCPDLYAVHFFQSLNFENTLFFPHGVNKDLAPDPSLEKKYDVVFLSSCIDFESLHESWSSKYPKNLCNALEQAAETTLSDQSTPYVEAFIDALNDNISKSEPLDPNKFHLMQILDDLEMYIRGKDRVELIKGIKDAPVHIFGAGKEGGGWDKYIGSDNPNVKIHSPVPFEVALDIMKKSKIVLSSCPWIKNGGHERIFAGMASGALVITSDNPYMSEHFENGKDLAFYYHGKWADVNAIVNEYLADESKREQVAESGREKVMANHTWDHRVKALLEQLQPISNKLTASST